MKSLLIGLGIFLFTFSAGAGTFLETFDDGELGEWQELVFFGAEVPGPWKIVDGELQFLLNQDDGGLTRLLTIGDELWQDYDIEFDVRPLKKHGIGNIAIAARIKGTWGVVCTIGDLPMPEPESMVRCFGGNLYGHAFLHFEKKHHRLLTVRPLKARGWHHMKLSVHGNLLTFWINGKQVLEPIVLKAIGPFPNYPNGKVGFGVSNYSAVFDNVTITGEGIPNHGGLSVTPRERLTTTWASLKRF